MIFNWLTLTIATLVFGLLSFLFIGIWTNRDAKSKGLNNRVWTAVTVLIPFCIGFLIYVIANPRKSIVKCDYCNYVGKKTTTVCPQCGARLETRLVSLPKPHNNNLLLTGYWICVAMTVICYVCSIISIFI